MGDPRNWTDRKVDAVRSANAAADRAELRTCTLYDHGPDLEALSLSPCAVMNHLHYTVRTRCAGCGRETPLLWARLKHTRLSHRPWDEVVRWLVCDRCGSGPAEVRFEKALQGGGRWNKGVISRSPPVRRQERSATS